MINPHDLDQALKNLQTEMQRETQQLQAKETEQKTREEAVKTLTEEVRTMRMQIEKKNLEIRNHSNMIPRLKDEIRKLQAEQQAKHAQLQRTNIEYTNALRQSKVEIEKMNKLYK